MRLGRKGQPFYRIVAVDSRKKRDGAYIEKIGHYNPNSRPAELVMDDAKALKWLQNGAIPSDTVRSLLSRHGVMMAFDLSRRGLSADEINAKVSQHRQTIENKLRAKEEAARPQPAPKPVEVVETAPEASETPAETPVEEKPAGESENPQTEGSQS